MKISAGNLWRYSKCKKEHNKTDLGRRPRPRSLALLVRSPIEKERTNEKDRSQADEHQQIRAAVPSIGIATLTKPLGSHSCVALSCL